MGASPSRPQGARDHCRACLRLANGIIGDVSPVGEGVSELRIRCGPGYRLHMKQRGMELIILLCGGDKGSQARDIELAKKIARELENEDG